MPIIQTDKPSTDSDTPRHPSSHHLPPALSPVESSYGYLFSLSQSSGPRIFWTPCFSFFVVNERDSCRFRFEFLQVCLSRGDPPFVNLTDPDGWRDCPPTTFPPSFSSTLCLAHRSLLWAMRVWFLILEYLVATCVFFLTEFWSFLLTYYQCCLIRTRKK